MKREIINIRPKIAKQLKQSGVSDKEVERLLSVVPLDSYRVTCAVFSKEYFDNMEEPKIYGDKQIKLNN